MIADICSLRQMSAFQTLIVHTSLGQLLTQSAEHALRPLRREGRDVHVFNDALAQALGRMADDDLLELAVAWSKSAPWAGLDAQPFKLAGFLLE